MTYAQAKMIANSPLCYGPDDWRNAASLLLANPTASNEDMDEAADLVRRVQNAQSQTNHARL